MVRYTHKAKHKNAKGLILSAFILTCAIFSLVFALRINTLSSVLHISAIILFTFSFTLVSRFVLTEYEYTAEGDLFTVTETRMKRRVVSVRIYLSEIDDVISVKRRKDAKRRGMRCKIYDCRADLSPKRYHILVLRSRNFCNEGEEVRILIQPDEIMSNILKKQK